MDKVLSLYVLIFTSSYLFSLVLTCFHLSYRTLYLI